MTALLLALIASATDLNLLSLEAGGLPYEQPQTYGGAWTVERLVDGAPGTGWCSAADARLPFRFGFELEQRSALTAVELDASKVDEGGYPGISARTVEVWVSSAGPKEGFKLAATLSLPRAGVARRALPKETSGRWVRLVITGNWGHPRYTELTSVAVLGHPLEPAVARPVDGTWQLEDGASLTLGTDGTFVRGCEVQPAKGWTYAGSVHGRVASLEWVEVPGDDGGDATVVVSDDGATLRGSWHRKNGGSGSWLGKRVAKSIDCRDAMDDVRFLSQLSAERLGLPLSGLSFEGDDEVRVEEHSAAASLARLLGSRPGLKVRALVLGRASDPAADELKRLERRAQKLVQYLLAHGVPPGAADVGFGMLRVGAAVQVEPRVEVLRLDR